MKARLVPVFFQSGIDQEFEDQVAVLSEILSNEAEILEPVELGKALPHAEAVLFPQMLGDAYRQLDAIKRLGLPLLIVTSEFGTLSMWDWEIRSYLRSEGIQTIAPYDLSQTMIVVRGLQVKRELERSKLRVYQDNPGAGFQPEIFKRFYWWEDECTQRMESKFGIRIEKRSYAELGAKAKQISELEAEAVLKTWESRLTTNELSTQALHSALKLFIALKDEMNQDENIKAMGINCLNESHYSDTTPCLAWNMLYEDRGLIWGCEADTVSMLAKYILNKSLHVPVMMTNLYPFLLGQAALKHERINAFPEVNEPQNHILAAHCGYLGVLPQSFSTEWTLREKVLAIVDDNATAIDARLPEGEITLAKFHPTFEKMMVVEGSLVSYAQFPNSDCLNGAILKAPNGYEFMDKLVSHHCLLMKGHNRVQIELLGEIFGFEIESL